MSKTERQVVNPSKPKFCKHFMDDIIKRRNKNQKPGNFLDKKIVYSNGVITTEVRSNERKLRAHWSSKVLKWQKKNAIISDLNRATHIASFLADEIPKI